MGKHGPSIALAIFLSAAWSPGAQNRTALEIWRDFRDLLKADRLTVDRIRPPEFLSSESVLALLRVFREKAVWEQWETPAEIVRSDPGYLTFIMKLTQKGGSPWDYTFNFLVEGGHWYFRFLEGRFIRMDRTGPLPVSRFPDVSGADKAFMRQEIHWSRMVSVYNTLKELKGREDALAFFRDGAGYVLGAQTWVPFFPREKAFILYLCWDQANRQGDKVTLEELEERRAVVRFDDLLYFSIYNAASHLKEQISLEEYIGIFRAIWEDRAEAAGWTLEIDGRGRQIYLIFSR